MERGTPRLPLAPARQRGHGAASAHTRSTGPPALLRRRLVDPRPRTPRAAISHSLDRSRGAVFDSRDDQPPAGSHELPAAAFARLARWRLVRVVKFHERKDRPTARPNPLPGVIP